MKQMSVLTLLLPAFIVLMASGCRSGKSGSQGKNDILIANMDSTVSPRHDFFRYADGRWLTKNPIPSSEPAWGIGNLVQEETYARLRRISENAARGHNAQGTALQKIGDFFFTGMDSVAIESKGITPLRPELDRISHITDLKGLLDEVARLQTFLVSPMFDFSISQDLKNSSRMEIYLSQGGLGLPNRDYYFRTDLRTVKIRKEYLLHMARMMRLLGESQEMAGKHAARIMAIETSLASRSRKLEDLRDPYRNYNKMSVAELSARTPSLNWNNQLAAMGIHNHDTVIVGQPEFLDQLEKDLKITSLDDWKTYLRWHLISATADKLNKAFEKEYFYFHGTVMAGMEKPRDKWKRVLDAEEQGMGELLGQLYVKEYFSAATKTRYETLVNNIIEAYRERIRDLDWMSAETKSMALEKLSKVVKKVGYPDKWKNYSSLVIDRESYVLNVLRTRNWEYNYKLDKLDKPVDRSEWDMTPQTYNAYYNPSNNEIVLPAAIFIIPGLPDSLADDAIVYAYAGGSTIGHEITHGFDDEGRQYDALGNLHNWWTNEDETRFSERTKLMVRQFDSYIVLDSMHVNGKASLGENIADLGGVILGYQAFRKTRQAKEGILINGLTPDQRYFLGYALAWLEQQRDQQLARQIMTDVHAPAFLRVNAPLSNIPEFYAAFGVKPGDAMYRPDSLRVRIW
jgi:putative endopeptidase